MDSANNQKILGYFIEEAREHLETLAQGLMDLPKVINDPEEMNELFRAAHSVKGGSAMLGYNSIQRTAHRLEDCFKILKEHDLPPDTKLESLFLKGYDTLHTLIDQLDGPFGLQDAEADKITEAAAPDFAELERYLNHLVDGGTESKETSAQVPPPRFETDSSKASASTNSTDGQTLTPAQIELSEKCQTLLKEMLELFRQEPSNHTRKELQRRCVRLAKLAQKTKPWQRLTKACHQTVGNPKYAYPTIAPVVIQDLKRGSDQLVLGEVDAIAPSTGLKKLAKAKIPYILIPADPKAAAQTLKNTFDQKQISQLVKQLTQS